MHAIAQVPHCQAVRIMLFRLGGQQHKNMFCLVVYCENLYAVEGLTGVQSPRDRIELSAVEPFHLEQAEAGMPDTSSNFFGIDCANVVCHNAFLCKCSQLDVARNCALPKSGRLTEQKKCTFSYHRLAQFRLAAIPMPCS